MTVRGQLNCNPKNQSPGDYTAFHFSAAEVLIIFIPPSIFPSFGGGGSGGALVCETLCVTHVTF